ncbi:MULTISPECIES: GntR family transcriptional regulator [unclassified Rathayibacter]|uniref:GntR family transcriptional regulator n=1 Tax=unclassified Rathayibacter TaxID=2609250 RepID=UPI000CE836C0|nr:MULTISPECIES: GntR family transcriptional regulator [unclassified Rathayibacter]PPF24942.1 GntR family transcriptional regulator [Rathayibacter sp. AY1F2]PPG57898.1 GntR family transcriptional regulator [Rathayibacter sp. AY1C7]PPH26885.1 GntR family transcriptional regulator [Rathayibacter sp. AY1F9]PPH44340.1 GntR family transcriptional regulator [Rathayibacter sp. AY1F7]PPH50995.1 GntR family transcriptional regulator [Rathayibacter sp. AY1E1]
MTTLTIKTAEEITERFRGAIQAGQLGDGERLPTVRQTARDFGVAQATAAKAYKTLEQDGLVVTRTAAGTRVAPGASRAPQLVVEHARALADSATSANVSLDDAVAILRAIWA